MPHDHGRSQAIELDMRKVPAAAPILLIAVANHLGGRHGGGEEFGEINRLQDGGSAGGESQCQCHNVGSFAHMGKEIQRGQGKSASRQHKETVEFQIPRSTDSPLIRNTRLS